MNRVGAFFSHGIVAGVMVFVTAVVMQVDRGMAIGDAVKSVLGTNHPVMSTSGELTLVVTVLAFSIFGALAVRK